jgi:sec-independent protein translocase protein TatA
MGFPELLIVLVLVLLVFGGSRLPALGRSVGQARRELRAGMRDDGATSQDGRADRPERSRP